MKLEVIHTPAPPPPPPKLEVILTLTPDQAWYLKWVVGSRTSTREVSDMKSYIDLGEHNAQSAAAFSGQLWRLLDSTLEFAAPKDPEK